VQENHRQTIEVPFASPLESPLALKVLDYVHPREVIQDDRLGPTEKRTILSAWASDACAVESRPGFRWLRTLDDLSGLDIPRNDAPARHQAGLTRYAHVLAQSARRGSPDHGRH
jgi:hypothetical protein